ncbi:MAG: sodium:solute symporter family transporter [Planctomycetota bacterium]|jgi:SSS family solute:Na+ symporter
MNLTALDIVVFVAFFGVVVGVSMFKSRREKTGEDFFLASRGLFWPMIGLSLIAANISTEHFVGMAGQGAGIAGMAIASYEWMAAIVLVFVALFFLPKFLKTGIFTIPEYLEYRYNPTARAIMAIFTMFIYIAVTISTVIYSGGLTLQTLFGDLNNSTHLLYGILTISFIAAIYTVWGGLKAVAWADLFLGSALIIGGAITMVLGFKAIGVTEFFETNQDRMHMILDKDHSVLPWTALVIGLWIPNFYYWGLNQYISQRTLAAKTLRQGQLGVIFAAGLKLIIPFIIIFPGIMSLQLYGDQMTGESGTDAAYPLLIRNLVGPGVRAFIFAAISGAVISSLASMLNSASTIFTIDIYKRHMKKEASERNIILTGRTSTLVFVVIGAIIAFMLQKFPTGIFTYIQEFQGFISPGVLAAFVFGFTVKRAPRAAGAAALIVNFIVYGLLLILYSGYGLFNKMGITMGEIAFLNRMAISFIVVLIVMTVMTLTKPLAEPRQLPVKEDFDMKPTPSVVWLGACVIVITLVLYAIFW